MPNARPSTEAGQLQLQKKALTASSQRFDYEYDDKELAEVAIQVKDLSAKAQRTHVLFNVNHQDQGQRAAKALQRRL